MNKLRVTDVCPFALAEEDGAKIYSIIASFLEKGESICVDFADINLFATPFFNTSLGAAIVKYGVEKFDSLIEVSNLDPLGIETYEHSRSNAIAFIENRVDKARIASIVEQNLQGD